MLKKGFSLVLFFITTQNLLFAQYNELAEANTNFNGHLYKEAIPLYEKGLSKDPYNSKAMLNLALSYYYTNQPQRAMVWFERVVVHQNFQQYRLEYGQCLKMLEQYTKAKKVFQEYSKISPQEGNRLVKSCDFAISPNPMTDAFNVKNLANINSKSADYAPTFYGDQVIFSSARSVAIEKDGQVSWTNDAFNQHYTIINEQTKPQPLRPYISNDINDAPMSYLTRSSMVAITSNNFMDGIRHISGSGMMMDIYTYKIKSAQEWDRSTEQFFTFNANVNSKMPHSTGHPFFANNGTALYFSSDRPGGYGGYDLYVSYRTVNGWSSPQNLGSSINTAGNEMCPFVDKNEVLYFSSDFHQGYGGMDIFQSKKESYGWSPVQNLGKKVNSSYDDLYFIFDADTRTGYFSSNRKSGQGNEDIYQVKAVKTIAPVAQKLPMSIGDKIILNEEYFNPNDFNIVNRESREIYFLIKRLKDNPDLAIQINGYTDTKGPAQDNLDLSRKRARSLANLLTSQGIASSRIRHTGYGENFLVNNCKEGVYCSQSQHAENRRLEIIVMGKVDAQGRLTILKDPTPSPNADVIIAESLQKDPSPSSNTSAATNYTKKPTRKSHYAIGDVIEVASIYYEHSSANIDKKNSPGLQELLTVLKEHPHVVIEIGAHTDATGSDSYNKELSARRAKAVKVYLEQKGIASSRLVSKGYGESKILNRCKNGVKCSKAEHAINRRTEFTVIAQKGFKVGDIIKVDNINYQRNKAALDMANSRGLQEVLKLLKSSKISVEIRSHTDSKGSAQYNLELSQKRAKAVYDFLIKNGINKFTLKYKGYGESKLLNKCKDGVRCSSAEHAINRRTDFKVIGLK